MLMALLQCSVVNTDQQTMFLVKNVHWLKDNTAVKLIQEISK